MNQLIHEMILRCPKCKSDDVTKISRGKYLLRTLIYIGIIVMCAAFAADLFDEDMSLTIVIGLGGCAIVSIASFMLAIYSLIKGILTRRPTYYCGYCECEIGTPLQVSAPKEFDTMAQD